MTALTILQGVIWAAAALTCLFLALRLFIRIHSFGRFFVDDFLTAAAWLILLTQAIIWLTQLDAMYAPFQLPIGALTPTPQALETNARFMRTEVAAVFVLHLPVVHQVLLFGLLLAHRCQPAAVPHLGVVRPGLRHRQPGDLCR